MYVRIKIPASYDIWSTSVAGASVKPAKDEEGRVMIPLQKSSGSDQGKFTVELIYIETEEKALTPRGNLALDLATIDLPINNLCVSLFLPFEYTFDKFNGVLKEVQYFAKTPYFEDDAVSYVPPQRSQARHMSRRDSVSSISSNSGEKLDMLMDYDMGGRSEKINFVSKAVGVLPVRVEMPTNGQEFKFEQLLVMGGEISVDVNYTRKKNTSYGSERTKSKCTIL